MKLTQKMQDAINAQINAEMWSANLYLSMSVFCAHEGLDGFANWLKVQSKEELLHADEMMKYLLDRGGTVVIGAIKEVPTEFGKPLNIAEEVYKHECAVSAMIEEVVRIAGQEKDMPSQDFFWKFIREQVEEEATAASLIDKLKRAGDNSSAILMLDREMGQRVLSSL